MIAGLPTVPERNTAAAITGAEINKQSGHGELYRRGLF
jgi:hypothetical protein